MFQSQRVASVRGDNDVSSALRCMCEYIGEVVEDALAELNDVMVEAG